MSKYIIILLLFILNGANTIAQDKVTYTEDEIKLQTQVLEAKLSLYKRDTTTAIESFRKLLKTDQKAIAAFELSKIYFAQSDYDSATNYGQKAEQALNDKEGYMVHMLKVYQRSKNNKSYLYILQQLADKYNDNDDYYYLLVDHYTDNEEHKQAIKLLDKRQNKIGIVEEISKRKFDIYMSQNKTSKAEETLINLIKKYPNEILYLYNLASFYGQTDMQSKSKEVYKKILELNPYDENAKIILNQEIYTSKNTDVVYLQSLLPVVENPESPENKIIKRLIPYIDKLNDQYNQDMASILLLLTKKLSDSHSNSAKSKSIYGDMLYINGDLNDSKKQYINTLELDKSVFSVWSQLLTIIDRTGDYKALLNFSTKAIDYYPNQAVAYIYHSIANYRIGDKTEALTSMEEATMLSSFADNYTKQLFQLAVAEQNIILNKSEEAQAILTTFESNKDKLSFEILEKMSLLFKELSKTDKATHYMQMSIKKGNRAATKSN